MPRPGTGETYVAVQNIDPAGAEASGTHAMPGFLSVSALPMLENPAAFRKRL
jgi:hypothetical protein